MFILKVNNVLKSKVNSSYDYRNGEKNLYRFLTRLHAKRLGYDKWEYTLNPLTMIYWIAVDVYRYLRHKLKSRRKFKL